MLLLKADGQNIHPVSKEFHAKAIENWKGVQRNPELAARYAMDSAQSFADAAEARLERRQRKKTGRKELLAVTVDRRSALPRGPQITDLWLPGQGEVLRDAQQVPARKVALDLALQELPEQPIAKQTLEAFLGDRQLKVVDAEFSSTVAQFPGTPIADRFPDKVRYTKICGSICLTRSSAEVLSLYAQLRFVA